MNGRLICEECAELQNALAKLRRGRASREEIVTDIADVMIMCKQMQILFGEEEVKMEIHSKLTRLKKRINEDKVRGDKESNEKEPANHQDA